MRRSKKEPKVGDVFGNWTIVGGGSIKEYKRYWLCECSCDKRTRREVQQATLIRGASTSCGCQRKERAKSVAREAVEPGQSYGRLTVVSLEEASVKKARRKWLCSCACGGSKVVTEHALVYDGTSSCGCLQKESTVSSGATRKELAFVSSGDIFGRLTVLSLAKDATDSLQRRWNVRCSCGVEKVIREFNLTVGKTQSCGCLRHDVTYKHGRSKTKEYTREKWRAYAYRYPERRIAKDHEYRARKLKATVLWARERTNGRVRKLARLAIKKKEALDITYHIDHVVPLKAGVNNFQVASGLHVYYNLQLLTEEENVTKGNRHWPNMWDYSNEDIAELARLAKDVL